MRELVVYPDAEAAVIEYLEPFTGGVPIDVRRGAGTQFIRVRRVGGDSQDVALDLVTLDVYVWHDTDKLRMRLAQELWAALRACAGDRAAEAVLYYRDTVLGPRQMPDPADDTKTCAMFTVTLLSRAI